MANDKLSASYLEAVNAAPEGEPMTALVRTKTPEPDRTVLEQVESMLRAERLGTRRADILRQVPELQQVTERFGRGPEFRANLEEATTKAQAKVLDAAPQGSTLWLADAVVV